MIAHLVSTVEGHVAVVDRALVARRLVLVHVAAVISSATEGCDAPLGASDAVFTSGGCCCKRSCRGDDWVKAWEELSRTHVRHDRLIVALRSGIEHPIWFHGEVVESKIEFLAGKVHRVVRDCGVEERSSILRGVVVPSAEVNSILVAGARGRLHQWKVVGGLAEVLLNREGVWLVVDWLTPERSRSRRSWLAVFTTLGGIPAGC
jgi:hypothetical protein